MKKFTTLAAAAAIAVTGVAPSFAQDSNVTSDPFVSTQGADSLLALGGAGGVVITVSLLAFLLAIIDSSSSSTT